MFALVRFLIGIILFVSATLVIRKVNLQRKRIGYAISGIISAIFVIISMFLPFENLFIKFDTPESAYRYVNFESREVKLVVDGQNADLVIGEKGDSDVYFIVPKASDGWKVGLGTDTKLVAQKNIDGLVVHVYQYKKTYDYFITVLDTAGGSIQICDSRASSFNRLERHNSALNKDFVTYCASIPNFDQQYRIYVNGEEISFSA